MKKKNDRTLYLEISCNEFINCEDSREKISFIMRNKSNMSYDEIVFALSEIKDCKINKIPKIKKNSLGQSYAYFEIKNKKHTLEKPKLIVKVLCGITKVVISFGFCTIIISIPLSIVCSFLGSGRILIDPIYLGKLLDVIFDICSQSVFSIFNSIGIQIPKTINFLISASFLRYTIYPGIRELKSTILSSSKNLFKKTLKVLLKNNAQALYPNEFQNQKEEFFYIKELFFLIKIDFYIIFLTIFQFLQSFFYTYFLCDMTIIPIIIIIQKENATMKKRPFLSNPFRNKLMKDVKMEIQEINNNIDNKLISITDDYNMIIEKAEALYLQTCNIYSTFNYFNSSTTLSDIQKHTILENIDNLEEINKNIILLKKEKLIKELLHEKLDSLILEDLAKIKIIEIQLKKIDCKTSMIIANVSLRNIIKKISDFCKDIVNEFTENNEKKVLDAYVDLIEKNSLLLLNCCENETSDFCQYESAHIPKKYKNKKLTHNELAKIALENNFICARHKGDHQIFKNTEDNRIVVIPYKANRTASPGTQHSILSTIFNTKKVIHSIA